MTAELDYIAHLTQHPAPIARAFARHLLVNLGDYGYAAVISTNDVNGDHGWADCASHDHVNARALMDCALSTVGILRPYAGSDEPSGYEAREIAISDLIDAAWSAWRARPVSILYAE
jgi:hypothetical protein